MKFVFILPRWFIALMILALGFWLLDSARAQYVTNLPEPINLSADTYTATAPVTNNIESDTAAVSFINRGQVIRQRDQNGIRGLVNRLKAANLFTNWLMLFPEVGYSETNHTPDLANSTNGIRWNGSAIHSSGGAIFTGNGFTTVTIDLVRTLHMDTNNFFLYCYRTATNAMDPYALFSFEGTNAGFALGSFTNLLIKTNATFKTNAAPALRQGHCLIFRTNGSPLLWIYSGSYTNFTTNSVSTPGFLDALLTVGGQTNVQDGTTRTNGGGSELRAIGVGTGLMTYPMATNLFDIMRKYQAGQLRSL